MSKAKRMIFLLLSVFMLIAGTGFTRKREPQKKDYIKWVDCTVSEEMLNKVYALDVKYHNTEVDFHFTEVLSYLALKNGNAFSVQQDTKNLAELVKKLEQGQHLEDMYGQNKYFKYYRESYGAIFSEYIGNYYEEGSSEVKYGMKAYFPFAKGYWYNHYDDFGNSRNFGYRRKHLGHDLMGSVGTPIVATESGVVAELGWNRYGGWRVGVRSHGTKRYYYYAHLRKDRPYAANLKKGDKVEAGQVIGYLGNTGYSNTENKNLTSCPPHLHFGLQLIFDESQVQGNHEIWVDVYALSKFLSRCRAEVEKNAETKEYTSVRRRIGTE